VNQPDELTIDGGSSGPSSGFPAPEKAKAKAMPGDDGLGLEEQQGLLPVRPNAPQTNPKQSVGGAEFGFASLAFEHGELMPEGQILEHESGMGLEASEQATEKQQKELEHDRPTLADEIQKSMFSTAYGVFATHTDGTLQCQRPPEHERCRAAKGFVLTEFPESRDHAVHVMLVRHALSPELPVRECR
jgi:hypothetical protein